MDTAASTNGIDLKGIMDAVDKITLDGALGAMIILVAGWILIRIIMRLFKRMIKKLPVDKALSGFLGSGLRIILYFVLIITVADKLGLPVTSLVALLSLFALAISLSVQNVLANVVSGIVILTAKPFTVGDYIEANTATGTVDTIGLMYTHLVTFDNKRVLIPNSELSAQRITNYSANPLRRVDIAVRVGYEHSNEAVFEALRRAAQQVPEVEGGEKAPVAVVTAYAEGGVEFALRVWTREENYWPVYNRLMADVRTELKASGIELTSGARRIEIQK